MLYDSERGDITIALMGDVMPTRRLSVFREERYLKLRQILTDSDATFANLETSVHRLLEGSLGISGGTYMTTEPHLLEDLKWLGVNLVSCANNHAFDYGEDGILKTCEFLDEAGISHAGTGRNLREARSPAYLDTPRGRVALIAVTSQFRPHNVAGEQRPDVTGRPGVNPLRHATTYMVDARGFDDLRHIGALLDFGSVEESSPVSSQRQSPSNGDALQYVFGEMRFERADRFGVRTTPNPRDVEENLRQIKEARRMADWVIASLHCHKLAGVPGAEDEQLADFAVDFAHRCIDSGADIFVGHGPQKPLGIELYRDRPIFYSLGSTVFQLETPRFLPEEAYARYGLSSEAGPADFADARYRNDTVGHPSNASLWKQVFAKCRFAGRKLARIDLYPLDLGFGKPRWQRGRPLLADEQLGREIIDQIGRLSKTFGTRVCWDEGYGVIITR